MTTTQNTLLSLFTKLVRIDSPTGDEQEVGKFVVRQLRESGWKPTVDDAGNIFVAVEGKGEPLFLCAHLDTVEPGRGIEPMVEDGIIYSEEKTVLGADNKAAVTALLNLLERRAALPDLAWRPLEVLFTVNEEEGSGGADAFDYSQIHAEEGYVFDAGEAVGTVTTAAPFYAGFDIKVKGEAMHASEAHAARPTLSITLELVKEIEALRDSETIVNIGKLSGGSARNTVIGSMKIHGEVRAFDKAIFEHKLQQLQEICGQDWGQPVFLTTRVECLGYKHDDQMVKNTVKKIETILGESVKSFQSFGCSDANVFNTNGSGLKVFDIGDGVFDSHTFNEHISLADLEKLAKLAQGLALL